MQQMNVDMASSSSPAMVLHPLFQRKVHPLFRTSAAVVGAKSAGPPAQSTMVGRQNFFTESFRGGTRNDPTSQVSMARNTSITVDNQTSLISAKFDENARHASVRRADLRRFQRTYFGPQTVMNR